MEEDTMLPLEEFLKEYDINVEGLELTSKEKLEMVKKVIFKLRVDRDWEDLVYSKKPQDEKNVDTRNEYVNKINNLDIRIMNATGYGLMLKAIIKEERKLKRKESFQKVMSVFKKQSK